MNRRDYIKKEIAEDEIYSSGEGTVGSGSVDLEADDDSGEALKKFTGNEPTGETLADEIAGEDQNSD